MNKRIKGTLIFCSCAALLCGCTQSNIVTPSGGFVEGNVAPDFSPKGEIQIDWGELTENLRDEFIQPYGTYGDYVMDLAVYWDDDENALMVLLPVLANTPSDVAVSYAQDVLKALWTSPYADHSHELYLLRGHLHHPYRGQRRLSGIWPGSFVAGLGYGPGKSEKCRRSGRI